MTQHYTGTILYHILPNKKLRSGWHARNVEPFSVEMVIISVVSFGLSYYSILNSLLLLFFIISIILREAKSGFIPPIVALRSLAWSVFQIVFGMSLCLKSSLEQTQLALCQRVKCHSNRVSKSKNHKNKNINECQIQMKKKK